MREIKFRYRDADGKPYYKTINLPDDAAQLVGYDANGNEVYEGDIVVLIHKSTPTWNLIIVFSRRINYECTCSQR